MSGEKRQFSRVKKAEHTHRNRQKHKDFSHGQQKGLTPGPEGHGRHVQGPKDMHYADCSLCGTNFQVPFKPIPNKAVYCPECLRTVKPK